MFRILGVFSFFIFFSSTASSNPFLCKYLFEKGSIHLAPISKLRPSQSVYGKDIVEEKIISLYKKAKEMNLSIYNYIRYREKSFIIPVILSPKGEYFLIDAHHGIAALNQIRKDIGDVELQLLVKKNYQLPKKDGSIWSYQEFIDNFLSPINQGGQGKGYFTESIRHLSPIERFQFLPKKLHHMEDSLMRSLVGSAMITYGINSILLTHYIEFHISETLIKKYPSLKTIKTYNPANIQKIATAIFSDTEIIYYLKSNPIDKTQKRANELNIQNALHLWKKSN